MEEKKEKKFDLKEKANDVKEKAKGLAEKVEIKKEDGKVIKPLVTCRILFISALDKILLVFLLLCLVLATIAVFAGDLSSLHYGFFSRVAYYILVLIFFVILYLFLNWLYKCAAKTMLCLTENEVYLEHYVPFKRTEKSIPLNKITKVTAIDILWIFRVVIIHQYMQLPKVFWTWNNHEFKDKLNELITTDSGKVENEFKNKNILPKRWGLFLAILGIIIGSLIILLAIGRFIGYMSNPARSLGGTYYDKDRNAIVLNKNGSCSIDEDIVDEDKIIDCTWEFNEYTEDIQVRYEYEYESGYYYTYTYTDWDYYTLAIKDKNTLVGSYDEVQYKKEK